MQRAEPAGGRSANTCVAIPHLRASYAGLQSKIVLDLTTGHQSFDPLPSADMLRSYLSADLPRESPVAADIYTPAVKNIIGELLVSMRKFGLPGTARASFYFYNTTAEIDRMIEILESALNFFS